MQQQRSAGTSSLVDPYTQTKYALADGEIEITPNGKAPRTFPLPNIGTDVRKDNNRFYLKFTKKNQPHVTISPQGTLLTSKSDRIQQVEMNISLDRGQIWWELFVPHTTLILAVGVKDKKQSVFFTFDFCLKNATKLQFKLNVDNLTFKAWINGLPNGVKPPIVLEKGLEWIPFVRIREIGTTLSLNPFIPDPQHISSELNPFQTFPEQGLPKQQGKVEEKVLTFEKQSKFKRIQLVGQRDNLLISGQNQIKLIKRSRATHQFHFEQLLQKTIEGDSEKYLISISQQQVDLLSQAEKAWDISILGTLFKHNEQLWISKNQSQWSLWLNALCVELDRKMIGSSGSKQLATLIYRWVLQKIESLRGILANSLQISSLNAFDSELVSSIYRNAFHAKETQQNLIESSLFVNNTPYFSFSQPILSTGVTQNYALLKFPSNKVTVFSTRTTLFKIGDFIISKAIKKENQLAEYRKQAEQMKENDFSKPSIYKILKNCLKYADKVKPPEKLIKELQQKKAIIKEKEIKQKKVANEIVPDKELQNTLVQMGFDINVAKKALIQCKNSSLEAAMDLILSGSIKVQPVKAIVPKKEWNCESCTLLNPANVAVCGACEAPAPTIDQKQEKKQQVIQPPVFVEQEIKSQKIDEELKEVYAFETNIGFIPLIIGGVFKSQIRFRLFCLNPKFYSNFYEKNDAYVNLINNSLGSYTHEITSSQIQSLSFSYYDQAQLKEKSFAWIPIEDYDEVLNETVSVIRYETIGFEKQQFTFKAYLSYPARTKCLTFKINTSNVYLEKQKSFMMVKQQWFEQCMVSRPSVAAQDLSKHFENCKQVQVDPESNIQFEAIFARAQQSAESVCKEVQCVSIPLETDGKPLNLSVVKSPQQNIYPHVLFVSPQKQGYITEGPIKNSLVVGNLQNLKINVQAITLQNKNKEDKIDGFIWFSNDYTLEPLTKHKFRFEGNQKKLSFKFEGISASYIVFALEPSQDDKIVEISNINVYGTLSQATSIESRKIRHEITSQNVKISLLGVQQEGDSQINDFQVQSFIINPKFDLTFLDSNELRMLQDKISPIVKLNIRIKSQTAKQFSKVIFKSADIAGYKLLTVDSSKRYQIQTQTKQQLKKKFHNLLEQYLVTSDKSLLQSLISQKYSTLKSEIKGKNIKQFIINHIVKVPFDSNKKFYFEIFINSFEAELRENKTSLDLQNIIIIGLKDENLTAFGLELLLKLNHITNCISTGKLMEVTLPSLRQIKQFKAAHSNPYSPYKQKTIFSPYIHQLLIQDKTDSSFNSLDRIHQSIILRKHKFSRSYIIDFFSLHHLRSLDLVLEQSQTQNKMIISIKWLNIDGKQVGSFNHFVDYEQWSQLVSQKRAPTDSKNFLSIDLKKHQIQTRYLIVECNFTLKPSNGAKVEVQNLVEKDIIPIAYGNYVAEQQPIRSLTIQHLKDARFICKTLNFNKYALQGVTDSFYFEEDEVKPEIGDAAALQSKLQLRENKDKWVKLQMNNPNNKNIDFHYSFLCQVAQSVTKSQVLENEVLSNEWIISVVNYITQDEYSPIQQIGIKAVKHLLKHRPDLHSIILNCQFRHPHLISTLFKRNPLLNNAQRTKILSQLIEKADNQQIQTLANNCLILIKTIKSSQEVEGIRDLAVALLKTFRINDREEEICEICNTFGWIDGVDEVFSHSNQLSTKKALVKASKTSDPLLNYLKKEQLDHPSQSFWIIFEQIIDKGFKASEFNEIVDKFLKLVEEIGKDEEESGQSFMLFERFIKTVSKVTFSRQISGKIINIYFSLENRGILLSQFLKSSFLSQPFIREILIDHAIRQLQSVTFGKASKSNNQDQLNFLIDVFAFIYKEQKPYFNDNKKIKEVLYHITAQFLHRYVNFGGVKGCRHLKQTQIDKITLCHYLTLEFSKEEIVNNEDYLKFAYWYVLNLSEANGIDAKSLKKFKSIHDNIWKVLVCGFKSAQSYAPIIGKVINNVLEQTRSLKDNRFLTVIYQSRVYAFLKQVFQYFEQSHEKTDFLPVLLKKSSIFTKILSQISQVTAFETSENLTLSQKEVANSLKFLSEEKPKDWTAHKHGAKQHVFNVDFNKGSKQFNSLTFESKNLLWLSEIVLGFEFNSQVLAPKDISLEIGQSEETMKLVGNFELIPLESYLTHSVKVFAINFHRPNTKKWFSSRNAPCRFIRIIIKSPYSNNLLEDIDKSASSFQQVSKISFLSINAYEQNGTSVGPNDVHDIVDSLEILSSSKNKELLGELLNQEENIKNFQKSLLNISYLMGNERYGLQLHRFLMRVCELNIAVGNTMLKEYLQLKNPYLYSKIASEIAGSNLVQSGKRASCFIEFILHELQSQKQADLVPFINKFTQLASTLQKMHAINSSISEVSIEVPQKLVKLIIKRAEKDISYKKFARLILSNQKPLLFTGFSSESLYEELYQSSQASDLLASLITGQPNCTKWFIEKNYIAEIFNAILVQIKENQSPENITSRLNFLTILCQSSDLKEAITKSQYDLKIFELLVSKDGEKLLSQSSNKQLRERLVEFIARASLRTENEKIIGALLKDSLGSMVLESSQQFVAEIFLPLLNSYSKTTVSLLPYNKSESRLMTDLSTLKIQGNQAKVEEKPAPSFKLASQIITQAENVAFFSKFKEISQHKWGTFNLLTNHGKLPSYKSLDTIKRQVLKGQKSVLVLLDSKARFGAFFNHSKESSTGKNSIGWTRGSFIFEIDEKGTISVYSYVHPKEDFLVYEHIHKSEFIEQSDTIKLKYKNKIVAQLYFDSVTPSMVLPGTLRGNQQQKYEIQSAEYWVFDSDSINSYQTIFANQQSFAKKLLAQLSDYSFFKTELKANKSLQLLRQEPLYEFPSSITLKELKKSIEIYGYVFSDENVDKISLRNLKAEQIKENATLDALSKKNAGNDLILELLLETDSLPPIQSKSESNKIEFLPRKGILKYFEENDGVKAMIKVIKKSIGEWKNQARKEKWEQYAIQLENFSAFPHFFSAYLKDKDTFKLLLDLLSGLPDKETDAKWDELQVVSSQKLLKIVSDILSLDTTNEFRNYALKNDFMSTILERLRILSGIFKRKYEAEVVEEVDNSPSKKEVGEDDGTKKIKKKKGVGYGNDTNSNTKWMKGQNLANLKKEFENIGTILTLVESFLNIKNWNIPKEFLNQLLESSLLPYIEDCLRAGTLLEISKHPQKFTAVLKLIRALARQQKLLVCLLPLGPNYQPTQTQSIQSLLKNLYNISKIFISCLNQNLTQEDKISKQFANDIIETYDLVQQAIEERANVGNEQNEITNILSLPLDKKYRELLKDLRFDYIDMKESPSKIKHHYASNFTANYTPNHNKMIRLAQELADISTALPHEHTNAIFVRCDKDRVDFMQALIMGSNGTPYGHGAFLFDIYFDDNYPNGPPKVNLTTTGHGKIRFNPNLYSCGKVCLSLLGTWRGSASENWDAKVSTLLQVLLSIQAIIMSEQVYFNEPGFENEQGTEEGQKKNQAYSNIVRYGNVKFAMLENIKNPPKGFEAVIRRHFYLKKDEILEQCKKWLKYAEKRPANYVGLVNDHNVSWSTEFKKSKTQYKQMLEKAIKELQEQLQKLPPPKITDITPKHVAKKEKKRKDESKNALNALQGAKLEQIDVSYEKIEGKELDINDEKVRDRWSRYIGAMGIDAVSKQSKADILILGLGPFGLEVIKNIVLSGCRKLTLCDDEDIKLEDLSGGFFYREEDVGKKRVETIIHKIRQLNSYVKIDSINIEKINKEAIAGYSLVFVSEVSFSEQKRMAEICRESKVKFISADCRGAYCRLVNDFGEFTVLDKNGQQPTEVMLGNIDISQQGLVTLLEGAKHPFEDGEAVYINHVEGMNHIENKDKTINGTIHTIKVVNYKSFEIGNTLHYEKYIRNGTAKNIKTPVVMKYRPFEASIDPEEKDLGFDSNIEFFDFSKLANERLVQRCFIVLDLFRAKNQKYPEPWNAKDAEVFIEIYTSLWKEELATNQRRFIQEFAFTCRGYLPPLCAFFGGLAAQQIIKAITQKYKPIHSSVYLEFSEIIPKKEGEGNWTQNELDAIYTSNKSRDEGFSMVVGQELTDWVKNAKLFMIGAGAIGCELLKNLAMVGLGTGKEGKIVLTDPDHIENSNLNRQFLFRQKHISKPKSSTAAASILLMNPYLKGHISALLERVSDSTKEIFSNKFFQSLTVVANALDNVAARRYVDQRCVENKIPLFESGTLGPKGHVQVIVPYKTESYGSQNDPVQEGEIPHCTLKMFPEETLHCVEWARDNFGKKFTLQPKALAKFLDKGYKPESDDIKSLNEALTMVTKGPRNFEDCINYAILKFYKYYRDDVMQLLYTYPLDAKTKNGEPFWRLPKRPPTPIKQFNPEDLLHCTFVTTLAVLLAKIYQIPYPQNFRSDKARFEIGKAASQIKIHQFVPSDDKAKAILKETTEAQKKQKKQGEQQSQITEVQVTINSKNEEELHKQLITEANGEFSIKHQQFEKDQDGNGHIDFIYSMANLRAINYKLDPMDWITTKLKAGRIVPALATTTSCVAGLQTLEICKYLKKIKIDQMRNSYLNLAVPSIQMSEPGEVKKTKITDKLTVTLWDRWELECTDQTTFGQVYKALHEKYGLFARGVLQGMSRIDHGKSEADQKAFLASHVLDKLEKEDNYIDIVVLFTLNENDEKILEGVPPVRLVFKK